MRDRYSVNGPADAGALMARPIGPTPDRAFPRRRRGPPRKSGMAARLHDLNLRGDRTAVVRHPAPARRRGGRWPSSPGDFAAKHAPQLHRHGPSADPHARHRSADPALSPHPARHGRRTTVQRPVPAITGGRWAKVDGGQHIDLRIARRLRSLQPQSMSQVMEDVMPRHRRRDGDGRLGRFACGSSVSRLDLRYFRIPINPRAGSSYRSIPAQLRLQIPSALVSTIAAHFRVGIRLRMASWIASVAGEVDGIHRRTVHCDDLVRSPIVHPVGLCLCHVLVLWPVTRDRHDLLPGVVIVIHAGNCQPVPVAHFFEKRQRVGKSFTERRVKLSASV